jgi:hypothetical protein
MSTRFTRQTDLKRSSGLSLSTPVRSLVERVAESAGLTYSDAIRLLVEEALAARAGRENAIISKLDALMLYAYNTETSLDKMLPQIERIEDLCEVTAPKV